MPFPYPKIIRSPNNRGDGNAVSLPQNNRSNRGDGNAVSLPQNNLIARVLMQPSPD